jgi:hypothetical protein
MGVSVDIDIPVLLSDIFSGLSNMQEGGYARFAAAR